MTDFTLKTAVTRYYEAYYRDALGIPYYAELVEKRLDEERTFHFKLSEILRLARVAPEGLRVLVVGAGTGGEMLRFTELGSQVSGIEPEESAVAIIRSKFRERFGERREPDLVEGMVEDLDESRLGLYDFVYCNTVLEHVRDPLVALDRMIAAVHPGGVIYIGTPDYRVPYEPHYKLLTPTFLPKAFLKVYFGLLRRPTSFVDSLQFVNARMLRRYFRSRRDISASFVWPSIPPAPRGLALRDRIFRFFSRIGIPKDQFWLIQKLKE